MLYRLLADAVVVLHLAFVGFAVGGALLVWRWRRVAWAHVPAALWAAAIEFGGWICPLTPLENALRRLAGRAAYDTSFVQHYIEPVVYPPGLTRRVQIVLGVGLVLVNVTIYGWVVWSALRERRQGRGPAADSAP